MKPPTITLNITKEIIRQSSRGVPSHCAIAQALRIQHKAESVSVTAESIRANIVVGKGTKKKLRRCLWETPAEAAVNAMKFDEGEEFDPCKIVLSGKSRNSFARDIVKRGKRPVPYKRRSKSPSSADKPKRCNRRFHGLKVIRVGAE